MSNRWLATGLLASALVSSLGCDSEGCRTGTTPGPGETCISTDPPDAGTDAFSADAIPVGDAPDADVPVDAPWPPDAFMPDAFLVVPDGCVPIEYWNDNDADGFGDRSMPPILACTPPANYAANGDDCNDASASVYPMRAEMCNGVDDNCDGHIDEALRVTVYRDEDGDGFGTTEAGSECPGAAGWASVSGDCNDMNDSVNPMRMEVCNGIDDNCAMGIDELLRVSLYRDADMDGFGTSVTNPECPGTAGWATVSGDCNDMRDSVNPVRTEVCNGIDDNCAMGIDEMLLSVFYEDADMDGYGANPSLPMCVAPSGYTARAGDCNDMNMSITPGRAELCNGTDDNCSAGPDETFACVFGRAYGCSTTCGTPGSYVCPAGCAIPACTPPAESCNYSDDDCDSYVDEGANAWTGPTTAALSNRRVELIPTSDDGFVRVLARSDGIYAQRYGASGVPTGTEIRLTTTQPTLFAAAVRDTALFVATYTSNTLTGYSFNVSTLTSVATPVASYIDTTTQLRIVANDDRLFIVTANSTKLDLRVRGHAWEGSDIQRVADGQIDFDLTLASDPRQAYFAVSLPRAVDLIQVNNAGTIVRLFRHATSAGTRFAQVAIGQTSRGQPAVGVLFHDNAGLASNVRFVLFEVDSATTVTPRGELALEVVTPSATPLDGAMDLAFSGGRFTASWLTSSGTNWQIGDIRPVPDAPTGTLSTIALGTPTTSLVVASGKNGRLLALHAQATAAARTWFRGCR